MPHCPVLVLVILYVLHSCTFVMEYRFTSSLPPIYLLYQHPMFSSCTRIPQRISFPTSKLLHPHLNPVPSNPRPFITTTTMSSNNSKMESASIPASAPGENYEPRQTHPSEDYTPDPSKSLPLSKERQALVDDILDLYSCKPTVQKVRRYTADCVYDDQFVYANDRYKMAGQWFALPKLFKDSKTEKYQIVKDEPGLIQFRNEQVRFPFFSLSSRPFSLRYADRRSNLPVF